MNINFDRIFLNDNNELKQPEKIANSILLIKDLNIASYVKLEMIEWLNLQGYKTSFLPEIATIYDLARDISGMGVGKEIREEDFIVLMERCNIEGLLLKFKLKKYRNYKKNLFRLIDHISLYTKNNIPNEVQNDLDKNGLTKNVIFNIIEYINKKEFYFKGQIFDKAIDIIKANPKEQNIFTLRFSENEISFKEKSFIDSLNAQSITIDLQGEYSALTDVLQDKDAKFSPEKLEFYKSNSALDQAIRVKHLVLSEIEAKKFELKDIIVVCSDTSSFTIMNELFDSSGIPVNSSHKYLKNDISIDILKLIQAGMNNDAQTVLNFFNLYIADEPVKADNMLSTDIETLSSKLLRRDSDIHLKFKSNKSKETVFKEFLRSIKVKDAEYKTEKGLTRLYGLIKNIKDILSLKIDYDVFQFKPTLLKIFGEKLLLSEMIEYLYLISSKTKRVRPYREQSGINISMMNEPLPDGKFIIFTDLIEGVFLKSSSTINILNKDSYKMFYQELYGVDQDIALLENFRTFISGKTEKIAFILPLWGDDIIVSTHLNKILAQFPKKKMDIKIAGDIHGLDSDSRLKDIPFSLTVNDIKDDENRLKKIPVMIEMNNLVKS
ncbi:MAG: hypothetical protein GQ534_08680 [Candidatus Delongbacteria bacterium]|nr:hypothetical protein [Candidatus Delongbacteria bacterium]